MMAGTKVGGVVTEKEYGHFMSLGLHKNTGTTPDQTNKRVTILLSGLGYLPDCFKKKYASESNPNTCNTDPI